MRAPYEHADRAEVVAVREQRVDRGPQRRQPDAAGDDHEVAPARSSSGQVVPNGPRTPTHRAGLGRAERPRDGADGADRVHERAGRRARR